MEKNKKRILRYAGTHIFGDFGLYNSLTCFDEGLKDNEIINFEKTKKNILQEFEKLYKKEIVEMLIRNGLQYEGLIYFSPKEYNYNNDSIDLRVSIKNKRKLFKFIEKHKNKIQQRLNSNINYDGYIALTSSCIAEIIEKINSSGDIDIMVFTEMFQDFREKIRENIIDIIFNGIETETEKKI